MRAILVCLALAAVANACTDNVITDAVEKVKDVIDKIVHHDDQDNQGISNKLYVKYAPWILDPLRKNSYFALPRTLNGLADTKDEVWRATEDALKTEGVTVVCRNNDYRVCLLVDEKKSTAGLRISVSVSDMEKSKNAPVKPNQRKNTMFGTEVYSTTIFFVNPEILKAGGRDMTEDTLTVPDGFFFDTGANGLRHIPLKEQDISAPYSKQNCFGGMGRHYFPGMTPDADCDGMDGEFALYNDQTHSLVGLGFLSYGTNQAQKNGRSWFEFLPSFAIKQIAPTAPACTAKYIDKYGTNVMHIFVVDRPWRLHC